MANELNKVFKNNTLTSVKALKNDESFVRDVIKILADDYDIKGLFADESPYEVLELVDRKDLKAYCKEVL